MIVSPSEYIIINLSLLDYDPMNNYILPEFI